MVDESKQVGTHGIKRKVLVVEDSVFNREMLCALLRDEYETIEAADGLEGLELLAEHGTDLSLILLDVYMPRCDGFEFLARLRSQERYDSIPVIVTTASNAEEDENKCLEYGANDFVLKPYKPEVVKNRVGNMIRLRESAAIVNQLTWDSVTRLYSKEFFYRAVEDAFADMPTGDFDIVCSDIENFYSLTDRYGEENCDRLLSILAVRIFEALPGFIAGGRIGGDVFAFLIEHQPQGWQKVLHSVTSGLPYANVNVKFGIMEHVDRSMEIPKICSHAISALETVKGRHGVDVAFFDDELHRHQMLEQTVREDMESALEALEFSVFFQPKLDVRTGRVGGAEALVRWLHPEIGIVSPGLFIPIFEHSGFITKLDMFVWEQACREVRRCIDLRLPVVPISVNASRLDFDVLDLPERAAALADKHGIDHSLVHIELTETAYSDNPDAVKNTLGKFKELGFPTELDDFGAGYSSLVSLNTLPLDVMKLDMSLLRQATALDDYRIVESTIKLAQVLGLVTVVEGVETEEEARRVSEMGCDLIQGFYYSEPLKRDDFEAFLLENARP